MYATFSLSVPTNDSFKEIVSLLYKIEVDRISFVRRVEMQAVDLDATLYVAALEVAA